MLTGRLIVSEHHTINETVLELKKRNVHISPSQVAYLAQKFVIYLSILHQQSASLLKSYIIEKGGYILHVDGTCDGDSPHLISAIDEVSNFVLVKNLDNPEYIDVILDGKESLEDAFAEVSQQEVMRKMKDAKKDETKIPRNVLLLIRQKETMQKLLYLIAS